MRCPDCGFNNGPQARQCTRCGERLRGEGPSQARSSYLGQKAAPPPDSFLQIRTAGSVPDVPRRTIPAREARRRDDRLAVPNNSLAGSPDVTGTVIATEPLYYEDPDFDGPRFLNGLLLLTEFLGFPILVLWYFMTYYGPVSTILAIMALLFFFRFINPLNLLAMLGIFHLLNPFRSRSRSEQVPVQYFRVRDPSQREVIVRRKGHLRDGHIMTGDEVALWGFFRGGTLHFRRGLSLRTGARITLQRNYSWLLLLLHLLITSSLIGLFYEPLHTVTGNLARFTREIGGLP